MTYCPSQAEHIAFTKLHSEVKLFSYSTLTPLLLIRSELYEFSFHFKILNLNSEGRINRSTKEELAAGCLTLRFIPLDDPMNWLL